MQKDNDPLNDKESPYLIGNDEPSIDQLSSKFERLSQENEKLRSELHEEKAKRTKESLENKLYI